MSMPRKCGQVHGKGMEGLQGVCGKCTGSVHGRCWKCLGSMWEVPGKCLGSAGEDVLEVVLSAESSANACKTSRKDVLRGQKRKATPRGFEPLRAEPNGFLVHHLNHSVTVSMPFIACHFSCGTPFWSSRAQPCWPGLLACAGVRHSNLCQAPACQPLPALRPLGSCRGGLAAR